MSDYIEREKAIDALEWKWAGKAAIDAVKNLPAADVVSVVRCKDCEHSYCRIYQDWQEPIYTCYTCAHLRSRWNTNNDLEVNPDDFCSYGKRREETE